MSFVFRWFTRNLQKHPRKVQFLTTGFLMGTSDAISQTIIEKRKLYQIEPQRIGRFAFLGTVFVGPALQTWYNILDRIIGNVGRSAGIKKVFVDQAVFAPCFLICFIAAVGILQFESLQSIKTKLNESYFTILKRNYMVWPAAQLITFYLCPLQTRVIFVSFVALLWNIYLSSEANKKFSEEVC